MEWRPYVHSPEEGTMEAGDQPWTIHVTVQPMPWPEDAETTLGLAPPTDDELGPEGETG